jgi:hypothetical protein
LARVSLSLSPSSLADDKWYTSSGTPGVEVV